MGMPSIKYFGVLLALSRFDVTTSLDQIAERLGRYARPSGLWHDPAYPTSRLLPLLHLLCHCREVGFRAPHDPAAESHPLEGTVSEIFPTLLRTSYAFSSDSEPLEWWDQNEAELPADSPVHALRRFFTGQTAPTPDAARGFFHSLFAAGAPEVEGVEDGERFVEDLDEIELRVARLD